MTYHRNMRTRIIICSYLLNKPKYQASTNEIYDHVNSHGHQGATKNQLNNLVSRTRCIIKRSDGDWRLEPEIYREFLTEVEDSEDRKVKRIVSRDKNILEEIE